MIDVKLNFRTNIEKACEKAARVNTALSRIMTNIGGPNQSRRLLLAKVTQSIMMYAAPVWGPGFGIRTYAMAARSLFRLRALRVANGFRIVSYEAIGGITPLDVMAMELKRIYDRVRIIDRTLTTEERREERQKSDGP